MLFCFIKVEGSFSLNNSICCCICFYIFGFLCVYLSLLRLFLIFIVDVLNFIFSFLTIRCCNRMILLYILCKRKYFVEDCFYSSLVLGLLFFKYFFTFCSFFGVLLFFLFYIDFKCVSYALRKPLI